MRVPLSWLREYVDWPWEPQELAERLTMAGVKIETVQKVGEGVHGVVAARVLKVEPHPNPDPAGPARPAGTPGASGQAGGDVGRPGSATAAGPVEGARGYWVVDLDAGKARRQVVAGIANMKPGDIVPYALPGSVLPGGWKIGVANVSGVASEGMLLSLSELVLGEKPREGEGVLVLPADLAPGADLAAALGLPETVLELDLTPNYAVHCQSVIGVAREVAALTGAGPAGLRRPDPHADLRPQGPRAAEACQVTIKDPDLCSRYVARVIRGVTLGPSPWSVQFRVLAAGMRPINNIVDATNYVMLEYGQPLHAFDLNLVAGRHIIVRRATPGERITTLDGVERALLESDLVIADEAGAVAVAGVMGGENSEVKVHTKNVLLESATFEPRSIRRTATRLALPSEAASRFDKGVDPEGAEPASARSAALIARTAGGAVAPGAVDCYPVPYRPREIALRTPRVSALLGVQLKQAEVSSYLALLGFGVRPAAWRPDDAQLPGDRPGQEPCGRRAGEPGDQSAGEAARSRSGRPATGADLIVAVPSWRRDVFEEADLAEEVGRLYGYDRIPPTLPRGVSTLGGVPPSTRLGERARQAMVGLGFAEIVSSSLVDPAEDEALSPVSGRALLLSNPLTGLQSAMRTGLLGSLVEAVVHNRARAERDLRLFEVAPVYWLGEGELGPANLPVEKRCLAAVAFGRGPEASWRDPGRKPDFYYAKGLVGAVLRDLGVTNWRVEPSWDRRFHPGRQAKVVARAPSGPGPERASGAALSSGAGGAGAEAGSREATVELGTLGELHPRVLRSHDIGERGVALEIDLDAVALVGAADVRFEELPRYPAVTRDVAVVLPERVEAGRIEALISASAGALCAGVELFDVYQGHPVPEGHRSTAWRVTYRSTDRSLTDPEVDEVHRQVRAALERELGALLR